MGIQINFDTIQRSTANDQRKLSPRSISSDECSIEK